MYNIAFSITTVDIGHQAFVSSLLTITNITHTFGFIDWWSGLDDPVELLVWLQPVWMTDLLCFR